MNEQDKKIVIEFSKILNIIGINFLKNKFPEELDIPDVIDIILSSYISSSFALMTFFSSDHKEISITVKKFINDMKELLKTINPIIKVEMGINK